MRAGPDALRWLLVGADRRSIARSNEALALLRADPTRIADLVGLVEDHDGLVALRAVDLLEKLAHEHPEWIQPHRMLFIGRLAQHPSWEIRLQIARALPLLRWTPAERARVGSMCCSGTPRTRRRSSGPGAWTACRGSPRTTLR